MNERNVILSRMFIVLGLILLMPAAIVIQLLRINVAEGEELRQLWNSQTIHFIDIPAERGLIYDRNGSRLVTNTVNYRVAIDPQAPGSSYSSFAELSRILSRHTGRSARHYLDRIEQAPSRSRYLVLDRNVDLHAYEEIQSMNARGVILEEEYRRHYNYGPLASHLLGFVNHQLAGRAGLERSYDEILKGEDGLQQVRRDRNNRIFAYVGAPRKQPVQGHTLHTTIDAFIQAITEEELRDGVGRTGANYGTAIVMDPATGEILSMANWPDYDPNRPGSQPEENSRNFAVADMVEPGSTFKLVTALAAVEQGVVSFKEKFETPEDGQTVIHGQVMRDHDPLGTLDFRQAIARSSNIAVSEIAMRLKPEIFYQYTRNLGFGTTTSVDLPGEESGRLAKPFEWSRVTLPWMSIGYEVQATPLQILQAYAAFANGGDLMKPYVVKRITDEQGRTVQLNRPTHIRRIAKKETIERLMPVFEEVVSDSGTASWAAVEGLSIAGKTGTAQKFIDGRYRNAYRASFVGFFPVDDPKYAILVMLDEPGISFYGGFTAGSIFREIARRIAGLDRRIQRSPDEEALPNERWSHVPSLVGLELAKAEKLLSHLRIDYNRQGSGSVITGQEPARGEIVEAGSRIELILGDPGSISESGDRVEIPDLRGMSMRQASALLKRIGLEIEMIGSGTIYTQFPQHGEWMRQGRSVTVRGKITQFQHIESVTTASN